MPPNGLPNGTTHPAASPTAAHPPSIHEASTVSSIRASLAALHTRDELITSQLRSLLSSQADISRELGRLDLYRAHLGTQVVNTRAISNDMLESAASTAQSLSGKVKELDLEKTRVEETLATVEQVVELKACTQGVVGSMGATQNWEAAAGYLARAERISKVIVEGQFAARVVPSVEVPDAPGITLENAKESLCGLFLREFERAAAEGDGARVTRFFKLFPLIGRGEVGLEVYGKYVCQGVAGTARGNLKSAGGGAQKDGFFYANVLRKLFDHIAHIVEGHGGLVERHYGAGKMVKVVERLQIEADVQGGIVLDTWGDERTVDRRLTDVKSYPFSFLVQSFLPAHRNAMGSAMGTPRSNSPAIDGGNRRISEDEGVDMKEVDGLLSETAVMLDTWSRYSRFLAIKCKVRYFSAFGDSADLFQELGTPEDSPLSMPDFLTKSALNRKINARLTTPFNIMTTFYFRRSVEKAFQLDESPSGLSLNPSKPIEGSQPFIITAVEDVMYIVDSNLQRSISTSQRDVIASVIPTISRVLGSDFVGMLQRKMRDESYPKAAIAGGLPPEDKIIAFIVLINSLDVANEYISRIVSRLTIPTNPGANGDQRTGGPPLIDKFPFDHDAVFVASSLTSLNTTFASKTSELISEGLAVLFSKVLQPRLRTLLTATFRDVDYSLSSSSLADLAISQDLEPDAPEFVDQVSTRFDAHWNALMGPLKRIMTEGTYANLLEMVARYLGKVLEKRIWGFKGGVTEMGAVRLERDFSGIVGTVCKGGRYGVRDCFARVVQVLVVVGMEEEEWDELNAGGEDDGMEWVLSAEERIRARGIVREE